MLSVEEVQLYESLTKRLELKWRSEFVFVAFLRPPSIDPRAATDGRKCPLKMLGGSEPGKQNGSSKLNGLKLA